MYIVFIIYISEEHGGRDRWIEQVSVCGRNEEKGAGEGKEVKTNGKTPKADQ